MFNISQSCDQPFEVNCGPRSELIVSCTLKRVIQEKTKARAHAAVEISESGMASIHLDVQSMMVKMQLQLLLYCTVRAHQVDVKVSKPSLRDGDGLQQQAAWQWILPCWQCRHDHAQVVMSLESSRQTNLEETRRQEASLPGCEILCKCKKMSFLNFAGTMGRKTTDETLSTWRWAPACRNAILRDEPPSKCCVSVQQFCSTVMASKSTGSATATAATAPGSSGKGGDGTKISNDIFQSGQIQHLQIEPGNKSQMTLLPWGNENRNTRKCSHKRSVVSPRLKSMTFTKMMKVFDCCVCS
jgi:hypothetical protein